MFASMMAYVQSFIPGQRLLDGGEAKLVAQQSFAYQDGLVAKAGGGAGGATQLIMGMNRVTVCAAASDSVLLPVAIPCQMVMVLNDGAQTLRTFPSPVNPNTGVADTIAPHDTSVYGASVDTAAAACSTFMCVAPGKWKQLLDA